MDDSFRARVQKAFGSLTSSNSPWSLTDGEVEKREWNRSRAQDDDGEGDGERDGEPLFSSSFNGGLEDEIEDSIEVTDDDDGEDGGKYGDGGDSDEWEIRSSIGMDCTLDFEEEEDEYDKVAEGRENAGERLYMRDVTDHGPYLNSYNVLPSSAQDTLRDPRANYNAARMRLKEDDAEAQKISPEQTNDTSMSYVVEPRVKASEDGGKLKSILKRKVDAATSKEQKRVRFDPGCKDDCGEAALDDNPSLARNKLGVPDYILNPSKYTHYSFDSSSDVDDKSNSQVYMEFLEMIKKSKPEKPRSMSKDESFDLPKSVTFVPRKKATGAIPTDSSSELKQKQEDGSKPGFPLGIAAGEAQISEVNVAEDGLETNKADIGNGFQKSRRQYRSRSEFDESIS